MVATEIGALANQSTQSVSQISNIINDLVSKSVQSLQIMEKVNGTVERQVNVLMIRRAFCRALCESGPVHGVDSEH